MSAPSIWQRFRQTLGRAVRETGQALDRLAVKTISLSTTKHDYYDDPVAYEDHLSRHRHRFPLLWSGKPLVHPDVAYLAPCSTLIGSVRIGPGSSVWYGAVLRADECANAGSYYDDDDNGDAYKERPFDLLEQRFRDRTDHHGGGIYIGADTNVQDNCIVTSRQRHTIIGNGVTVGHLAQIHSATIEDYCLIGMGAMIGEGAVIRTESFIAAGAVVKPGTVVEAGELWIGNPARKLKDLLPEERQRLHYQSSEYVNVALTQHDVMELGGNVGDIVEAAAAAAAATDEAETEETTTTTTKFGVERGLPGRTKTINSIDDGAGKTEEEREAGNASDDDSGESIEGERRQVKFGS